MSDIFYDILIGIAVEWEMEGTRIVEEKKADLSVPISVTRGPRGGRKVVRSKEGEPPRKETGKLQEGMSCDVTQDATSVTLTINDPVYYAGFLENKRRIVTSDVIERFGDAVIEAGIKGAGA